MDASESDIKKAYRKLSLQYHPDKNKGNSDAETKFQRISRAYEILSNPELKDVYDFEGEEGLQRHQHQGNRPSNPFGTIETHEPYHSDNKLCSRDSCIVDQFFGGGSGRQRGADAAVEVQVTLEELYNGGEKSVVEEMKTITGVVERGMPSNHEIVFERHGEQHPGIMPGNVIMRLVQLPHRVFRCVDALLGFDTTLLHLDGHKVSIAHDGVTKPFEVRRVLEEGMPHHHVPSQHGDLYVTHNIKFPTKLTDAQKDLVKRLLP
ncbi:hypothetical protein DYB32_007992 [Aphanomyces invadans]|uniref:J domain-containing protein n=1 Tax=Aphanomyces invadans TaxID=157072 RepID=A0A418AM76_9STRA|nr:hypothetical protein DYB32_007992 [Aphanomyces invadans]